MLYPVVAVPDNLPRTIESIQDQIKAVEFELKNPNKGPRILGGVNDTPGKMSAIAPVGASTVWLDSMMEGQRSQYKAPGTRGYEHPYGYGSSDNAEAARRYTDELRFAPRWGLAQIPGDYAWMGAGLANKFEPPFDVLKWTTGKGLGERLDDVTENAYAYWGGKADTQGDDPTRSPEGVLPNILGYGSNIVGDSVLTGPAFVNRAVTKGIDALDAANKAFHLKPNLLIDPSRRKFLKDAAATAAVGGTGIGTVLALKHTPDALSKADDVAKMSDDVYEALRNYQKGTMYENIGNQRLEPFVGNADPSLKGWDVTDDIYEAASDLNFGRKLKNKAIDDLNGADMDEVLNKVLTDKKLANDYLRYVEKAELNDHILAASDDLESLKVFEDAGLIRITDEKNLKWELVPDDKWDELMGFSRVKYTDIDDLNPNALRKAAQAQTDMTRLSREELRAWDPDIVNRYKYLKPD